MEDNKKLYDKAKDAYYNGEPIMTDLEFDELEREIGLENQGYVGTHHSRSYTVQHPFIMGSLSKIQVKFEQDNSILFEKYVPMIKEYLLKSKNHFFPEWSFEITPKFDGCSFECIIDSKGNCVSVSTRGDGEYGKDIKPWFETEWNLHFKDSVNEYLRNNVDSDSISYLKYFVVRGECLVKKSVFKQKYSNDFTMPRSFVAGCLGQDWAGTEKQKEMRDDLSFVCYDYREVYDNGSVVEIEYSHDGDVLDVPGCPNYSYSYIPGSHPQYCDNSIIKYPLNAINGFEDIYRYWENYRKECEYELDGFVIKPDTRFRIQDGARARQIDCVAIKFTPEIVETTVNDIEWNIGKTGEYYPTGVLDPIIIGGKNVSRVSLANYGSVVSKGTGIGSKIRVSLAGDIIPFVYEVTKKSDVINIPEKTVADNGHLVSNEHEWDRINFINSAIVLNIDGIGDAVAEKLYEYVKKDNILYIIGREDIGLTGKTKDNVINALNERKKSLTLADIIQSMNFKNCGKHNSTWLAKKMSGVNVSDSGITENVKELYDLYNNLKYKSFEEYTDLELRLLEIDNLREKLGVSYMKNVDADLDTTPVIMTGEPSNTDYRTKKEWLSAHPQYRETSSFKEAKILFTNDLNSTSGKMVKAKKNGVEIRLYE